MKKALIASVLFTCFSSTSFANSAGDILLRGGITGLNPDGGHAKVLLNGDDSTMTLTLGSDTQLGLNFVYFWDSHWAFEAIVATPFTHDITIHDPNKELNVDGATLAKVSHLPPTFSALYFFDTIGDMSPYLGVGVNYTVFFDEKFEAGSQALRLSNLRLSSSLGYALQLGVDYQLDQQWLMNASVRYIDISADGHFDVRGNSIGKTSVDINPMVYSLMLGYRF